MLSICLLKAPDALRLQTPSNHTPQGDYADMLGSILMTRCRQEPSDLTLATIHEMLDTIAQEDRRSMLLFCIGLQF